MPHTNWTCVFSLKKQSEKIKQKNEPQMNLSFTVWYCYNLQLFVKHKNGRKHENAMEIVEKTLPNNTAIHSIQLYVTSIDSSGLFNETEHPYQTLQCMENWTQSPHHENFFAAHADSALGITVLRDNQHNASAHQNTITCNITARQPSSRFPIVKACLYTTQPVGITP